MDEARREEDRGSMKAVDILIAEGDPLEADRIRQALSPILNRTTILTDAGRAMDYLLQRGEFSEERRTPDLVLLDADMIGVDCWKLVHRISSISRFDNSIIAVMGSRPSMTQAEQAREAGVDWIAGKPVSVDTLAQMVEDLEDMGLAVIRARGQPLAEAMVVREGDK